MSSSNSVTNLTPSEYIDAVKRTESPHFFVDAVNHRILHGAVGCVTESAELLDAIKKSLFYGKPLDLVNIQEELGDLLYYTFLTIDACGGDFEQIIVTNRNKLAARYGDKFSAESALTRDLTIERDILEKGAAQK